MHSPPSPAPKPGRSRWRGWLRIRYWARKSTHQAPVETVSLDALRTAARTINAAKAQFGDTLVLDLSENKLTALMAVE